MKRKNTVSNLIRLAGMVIFGICLYNTDISKLVWFLVGTIMIVSVIPSIITGIIFSDRYDGTFLIDETEPTDVKFKLTFDTDPEILVNQNDMVIRIDHREPNMDSDGGDLNG